MKIAFWKKRGIKQSIINYYLILTIIAISLISIISSWQNIKYLHRNIKDKAKIITSNLTIASLEPFMSSDVNRLNQIFTDLKNNDKDVKYLIAINLDGKCIASTDNSLIGKEFKNNDFEKEILKTNNLSIMQNPYAKNIIEGVKPVSLSDQRFGTLRIGYTHDNISKEMQKNLYISIIISILTIIAGSFIYSVLIEKNIISYLKKFSDLFTQIAGGNLFIKFETKQIDCSKEMNCENKDCPCYKKEGVYCWLNVGSEAALFGEKAICPKITKGIYKSCKECKVYKAICKNEIIILATHFNKFLSNIRNIISEVVKSANDLSKLSGELIKVSEQMVLSAEEMNIKSETVSASSEQVAIRVVAVASASEQSNSSTTNIATMTEEMSATFTQIAEISNKTAKNVSRMADAGEDMTYRINTVVTAVKEMALTLNEMSKNTSQASKISKNASQRTVEINAKMEALVSSSKQIGKIVGVIKNIADKTDMLALNATIEAAGAGEAGKGFAVVAGEVKELAKQSADATDDIAGQIENIQTSINLAVNAIHEINSIIEEIVKINETIASSVEEQKATSNEISKSVSGNAKQAKEVAKDANESSNLVNDIAKSVNEASTTAKDVARNVDELQNGVNDVSRSSDEAANAVRDIAKNIQEINKAARDTASGASQTNNSSNDLAKMATDLLNIVKRFKL